MDKGTEYYESKYRLQQLQWVAKQAAALEMQLIPAAAEPDRGAPAGPQIAWAPVLR